MRTVLDANQVADLIERFLENRPSYPQEWNDFIEVGPVEAPLEKLRKRCYELDPVVNVPGAPDAEAVAELSRMVLALRAVG